MRGKRFQVEVLQERWLKLNYIDFSKSCTVYTGNKADFQFSECKFVSDLQ